MSSLEINFNKYLDQRFLFENKPKIAVAVSGGPDSTALVFLLKQWIKKKKGKLIVLIVDHQIRNNSFDEASSVKKYLDIKNIKSFILKISKKNVLKGKMSQARKNRFSKMIDYCKKNQIFHLFLGHHYDDNIETFLLRKIAGSNIEGLNSMQEKTVYHSIQILRPLLNFSKKQILNYIRMKNLKYVQDPSNKNEKYSRVVVRNFLKVNSQYQKDIIRDFKLIKNNYIKYKKMIFQIFNLINFEIRKKMIVFETVKFLNLDIELQTKFIEIIYKFFNPKKPFLRYKKIVSVLNKLCNTANLSLNIASMRIKKNNNFIYFIL